MKKILISTMAVVLGSTLFFSGCSTHTTGVSEDAKTAGYTHLQKHMTLKELHKIIKEAGERDGWRMTEFKENAIIAEKTDDGDTTAVTVNFSNTYFNITPPNSDLQDAIEDAIEDSTKE